MLVLEEICNKKYPLSSFRPALLFKMKSSMNKHCHLSHHKHIFVDIQSLFKKTPANVSHHTSYFYCCRPFKKTPEKNGGGSEMKLWLMKCKYHTHILICRPSFEAPVWQNWSFLSLFSQILCRKPLLSSQSWQQNHFVQTNHTATDLTCARKTWKEESMILTEVL